mmetsp:Transcript_6889/g.13925  ORF Transcript_6889/g.13925 Transcript_6889/m.13925 type:complete len:303 (-) Transcript_6889:350-1258(-)
MRRRSRSPPRQRRASQGHHPPLRRSRRHGRFPLPPRTHHHRGTQHRKLRTIRHGTLPLLPPRQRPRRGGRQPRLGRNQGIRHPGHQHRSPTLCQIGSRGKEMAQLLGTGAEEFKIQDGLMALVHLDSVARPDCGERGGGAGVEHQVHHRGGVGGGAERVLFGVVGGGFGQGDGCGGVEGQECGGLRYLRQPRLPQRRHTPLHIRPLRLLRRRHRRHRRTPLPPHHIHGLRPPRRSPRRLLLPHAQFGLCGRRGGQQGEMRSRRRGGVSGGEHVGVGVRWGDEGRGEGGIRTWIWILGVGRRG